MALCMAIKDPCFGQIRPNCFSRSAAWFYNVIGLGRFLSFAKSSVPLCFPTPTAGPTYSTLHQPIAPSNTVNDIRSASRASKITLTLLGYGLLRPPQWVISGGNYIDSYTRTKQCYGKAD